MGDNSCVSLQMLGIIFQEVSKQPYPWVPENFKSPQPSPGKIPIFLENHQLLPTIYCTILKSWLIRTQRILNLPPETCWKCQILYLLVYR